MDGQIAHLPVKGVAEFGGLRHGVLHRDNDIPQLLAAGIGVQVVLAVFAQGEGEHVGGGVLLAEAVVHLPDLFVIGKGDVDLRVPFKMLHPQHGGAAAAQHQPQSGGYFYGLLVVGDDDFQLVHDLYLLAVSFLLYFFVCLYGILHRPVPHSVFCGKAAGERMTFSLSATCFSLPHPACCNTFRMPL